MEISIKKKEASTSAELKSKANKIRKDIVRMITEAKLGHPGGSLSAVDVVTALYFKVMRHNPKDPKWMEV